MSDRAAVEGVARPRRIAVVMPAYNEVEGLADFIREIAAALLAGAYGDVPITFAVVDDASTDGTGEAVSRLSVTGVGIDVVTSVSNRGHGPTALAAYRAGLATGADWIVHVDGDGQFDGGDFPRLLEALEGVDAVRGVRVGRGDPPYRRILTASLTILGSLVARRRLIDVNTPLRAYRREVIARLVESVPATALVPHVHFSILESRWGMSVRHVPVASRLRRGQSVVGTMWGAQEGGLLPPRSLRRFTRRAFGELLRARPWSR